MTIFNDTRKKQFVDLVAQANAAGNKTDADVLAYLNAASIIDNPEPQGQVARVMAESDIAGLISTNSLKAVLNWLNFALVKRDIEENNHVGVALWAMKLALLALITADEATAVQGYATTPVQDPDWQSHVVGPSPFQAAFSDVLFDLPDGSSVIGNAVQAMLEEVR